MNDKRNEDVKRAIFVQARVYSGSVNAKARKGLPASRVKLPFGGIGYIKDP